MICSCLCRFNMARRFRYFLPIILLALGIRCYSGPNQASNIRTTSGEVSGFINSTTSPHVGQYLGIPFAEDPIGQLRFSPPVAKSASAGTFIANKFGPSCPQYNTSTPTFFSVAAPEYYIEGPMDEACLSLNVWSPLSAIPHRKGAVSEPESGSQYLQKYPVIIFLHGGQFTVGGSRVAYHNPERWVERSQDVIVVTIKSVMLRAIRKTRSILCS
jgi:carboxylesterase type B